jgi:SAM-dependent methyltransferase
MRSYVRSLILKWIWHGWPDEGRRIVQEPHLKTFLARAGDSRNIRRAFNIGAGEGGYTPLLLNIAGLQSLIESDIGMQPPRMSDTRQSFFCSSMDRIPLASGTIDLVLCTEVLEHVKEDERALDEVRRITASRGWLVITVPTPPAPPDVNHVREGYRAATLATMLDARGFEIVDTRFCMYGCFRFLLANWGWIPRIAMKGLAHLDRYVRLGQPMDLMILARLRSRTE